MTTWPAADLARLAAGALDLLAPRTVASLELGAASRPADAAVFRVLGARQLAQVALERRTGWRALGVAVDLLHLASMLPVAAVSRRWRRAALAQVVGAGALATAGFLGVSRG